MPFLQILNMQQLSESPYCNLVKEEDLGMQSQNSPHPEGDSNGQNILLEEDDSDQLHFFRNKCKKKKKRKKEILDLNIGRWSPEQKKSFHLMLEVSFRTFINRMVFKKHFKLFTRRNQFFTHRSHSQARTMMFKLQRRFNRNFIHILINFRKLFYDSLNPQFVQNELRRRNIQSQKILTIQQLQNLYNQTMELKKYMMDVNSRESMLEEQMAKAQVLKQQEERKMREIERQKQQQALVLKRVMVKNDPQKKKSKENEYIPKKSKIMCFTMDPLTFQIINQNEIEE